MSMKKKLGSTLANGVRQVKSQREQVPAAPAKTAPVAKPAANGIATKKPVAPRTTQPPVASLDILHPRRIWPD